jgi:hypothetical protein
LLATTRHEAAGKRLQQQINQPSKRKYSRSVSMRCLCCFSSTCAAYDMRQAEASLRGCWWRRCCQFTLSTQVTTKPALQQQHWHCKQTGYAPTPMHTARLVLISCRCEGRGCCSCYRDTQACACCSSWQF